MCNNTHDWRDTHYERSLTPGCLGCERRKLKLAELNRLCEETVFMRKRLIALGLYDEEGDENDD